MEPVPIDTGTAPPPQTERENAWADYLVFTIEEIRYAFPVESVREVLPALAVDPLPGHSETLAGAITLRGRMVPVLDTRAHLGLAPRAARLADHFLLAVCAGRLVVVPCDRVHGIRTLARDTDDDEAQLLVQGGGRIAVVVRDEDGLVLVPDLRGVLPQVDVA